MRFNTKYFRTADEVEYVFGISMTAMERNHIEEFIQTGHQHKSVLAIAGEMLQFEYEVDAGIDRWPWPKDISPFVEVTELR